MAATQKEIVKSLKQASRALDKAREAESKAWGHAQQLMKDAHTGAGTDGTRLTFQEIADIFGITKARVYQVVTGNRGGTKPGPVTVEGHDADPAEARSA